MLPDLNSIGMDDVTAADIEDLARIYNGFGQRTRLAILLGFYYGNSTTEIADALGITRAGLTNHLQQMTDARLLHSLDKGYELTVLGRYMAEQVEAEMEKLLEAWHVIDITRHQLGEYVAEEVNMEMISDEAWEAALEEQLWEAAASDLEVILAGDGFEDRYSETGSASAPRQAVAENAVEADTGEDDSES